MITKIRGRLVALSETEARLEAGVFEYSVLVPDFVRRQMQTHLGEDVSLETIAYLEGNPQHGRLNPRLVGFLSDAEKQFFELICSVDGVGVKKALRAMVRPVREVATAIEEGDTKTLSTLPGIGPAVADRIVAKLRRKMAKFALLLLGDVPEPSAAPDVLSEAHEALVALGHSPSDAREKIESLKSGRKKFKSVEAVLVEIYDRTK